MLGPLDSGELLSRLIMKFSIVDSRRQREEGKREGEGWGRREVGRERGGEGKRWGGREGREGRKRGKEERKGRGEGGRLGEKRGRDRANLS